jgi:hypothetical protein
MRTFSVGAKRSISPAQFASSEAGATSTLGDRMDTHALIWAIDGNRKRLGKHARKLFDSADEAKCAINIPALVLAELGEACH